MRLPRSAWPSSSAWHLRPLPPHPVTSRQRRGSSTSSSRVWAFGSPTTTPTTPRSHGVTSTLITERLKSGRLVAAGQDALDAVLSAAGEGVIILTVGAGDVTAYGPRIVELLGG